jgi:hypothetical protein
MSCHLKILYTINPKKEKEILIVIFLSNEIERVFFKSKGSKLKTSKREMYNGKVHIKHSEREMYKTPKLF